MKTKMEQQDHIQQIIKQLKICNRCNHTWLSQVPQPKQCPQCHSPYYNKPRKNHRKDTTTPKHIIRDDELQ